MSSHRMTLRSKARRTAPPPPPAAQPEEESESESEESEDEPSITLAGAPARPQKQRQPAAAPAPKPGPRRPDPRPVYLDNAEYPVHNYGSALYQYRNNGPVPPAVPHPRFPRPPVPTVEHARASLVRTRANTTYYEGLPHDNDKQLVAAQTLQTWRDRVLQAPAADPSTNPGRQFSLAERIELIKGPNNGRLFRDKLESGDRTLMADRSEWLDWRLIAGSQYWVCPKCAAHVLTNDIPAHRAAHGVVPFYNTNTA